MKKSRPVRARSPKRYLRPAARNGTEAPKSKNSNDLDQVLARIALLAKGSQTQWLTLNAYLAFIATTLLGMRDEDFIATGNLVTLPLVQVQIDTTTFVIVGPALGLLLYMYFHAQLSKLWNSILLLPSGTQAEGLEQKIHPWLLFDLILSIRGDINNSDRPARRITHFTVLTFVWLTGPVVIAYFWWRSAVAHSEFITLFHSLLFVAGIYFAFLSWRQLMIAVEGSDQSRSRIRSKVLFWGLFLTVGTIGWLRSEGGIDKYVNAVVKMYDNNAPFNWRETTLVSREDGLGQRVRFGQEADAERLKWIRERFLSLDDLQIELEHPFIGGVTWGIHPLARIDIAGASFADRPNGWLGFLDERDMFRRETCASHAVEIPLRLCGSLIHNQYEYESVQQERSEFCSENSSDGNCLSAFISTDRMIAEEWRRERRLRRASIAPVEFRRTDLRHAIANNSVFTNALLEHSRFDGGRFWNSDFEGADLLLIQAYKAAFDGSNFQDASLRSAELVDSVFQGSLFDSARFDWAYINDSYFGVSDLSGASFDTAILIEVGFNGSLLVNTSFRKTKLDYPTFRNARLEGVSFWNGVITGGFFEETIVKQASLDRTNVKSVIAFGADLSGLVDVQQSQLDVFLADEYTTVPLGVDTETGKPFRVPTCWLDKPEGFDGMVRIQHERENNPYQIAPPLPERTKEKIEASWLCSGSQTWRYHNTSAKEAWEGTEASD